MVRTFNPTSGKNIIMRRVSIQMTREINPRKFNVMNVKVLVI